MHLRAKCGERRPEKARCECICLPSSVRCRLDEPWPAASLHGSPLGRGRASSPEGRAGWRQSSASGAGNQVARRQQLIEAPRAARLPPRHPGATSTPASRPHPDPAWRAPLRLATALGAPPPPLLLRPPLRHTGGGPRRDQAPQLLVSMPLTLPPGAKPSSSRLLSKSPGSPPVPFPPPLPPEGIRSGREGRARCPALPYQGTFPAACLAWLQRASRASVWFGFCFFFMISLMSLGSIHLRRN